MWQFTSAAQLSELAQMLALGAVCGMYYDVFRVVRVIMRPTARVIFVQDLAFFVSSAAVTFLFLLALNGGEVRWYLLLGQLAGFALYYRTVGQLVLRFANGVYRALSAAWRWWWRTVFRPLRWIGRKIGRPFVLLGEKTAIFLKKIWIFLKKHLQMQSHVLYNKINKRDRSEEE